MDNNACTSASSSSDPVYERPYSGRSYADLPMEITINIMDYLHSADLHVASLACTRWFNAAQHRHFCDKFELDFSACTFDEQSDPLATFVTSLRSYAAIQLHTVDFHSVGSTFWDRYADTMNRVAIRHCDLREKTLKAILFSLNHLTHLEIEDCCELFMSGRLFEADGDAERVRKACEHIEHLALINNRYISDSLFQRFVSFMPRLRSLNLARCPISFHQGLYRKFYPSNRPTGFASESVLTFQYIARVLLGPAAANLTHLTLSETLVDESALQTIGSCALLRLKVLELRGCDQLTNASIVALVRTQTELRELDVSRLARLTDMGLTAICRSLRELRVLKLGRCRSITDTGAKEISGLRELRVLDISDCDELTSAAILGGVAAVRNERMHELNLSALRICPLAVMRTVEAFPELRVLDVSSCKHGVTDLAVQWICRYALQLRVLRLQYCDKISDASLTGAGMDKIIHQLESTRNQSLNDGTVVNLAPEVVANVDDECDDPPGPFNRNPFKISLRSKAEEDIVNDALRNKRMRACFEGASRPTTGEDDVDGGNTSAKLSSTFNINRLRGLRTLDLTGCTRITDVWLRYSFRLPELRSLSLANCQQISSWGIERLVLRCPTLEHVDLSECHNINDRAVELLAVHLRRLTRLLLERCSLLTDRTLDYLALHCERLRHLDVRGCRAMCPAPSMRLVSLRSLRRCEQSMPEPYVDCGGAEMTAAVAYKMPRYPVPPPQPPTPAHPAIRRFRW